MPLFTDGVVRAVTDFVTHEAVENVEGVVERVGGTRRRQVVATGIESPADDVVRLDVDGSTYRAPISQSGNGDLAFRGAYDTPSQARDGSGTNYLADFLASHDLEPGRTVYVDIIESGFRYGVRAPGQTATYRETGAPRSSLADIARSLDE